MLNKFKSSVLSILLWSIISAAYIGPGSITVAAKAGISFDYQLLWTITFSTIICLIMQEIPARINILTGLNLGESVLIEFKELKIRNLIYYSIFISIVLGAIAYQAGNVLGTVNGLKFLTPDNLQIIPNVDNHYIYVVITAILAFLILSISSMKKIANTLGIFVILMTLAFIPIAIYLEPSAYDVFVYSFKPVFPNSFDAGLLILAMFGTTVIPYDMFLGSGVVGKNGQTIKEMRLGLSVAVILGGVITLAIYLVGVKTKGSFSLEALSIAMQSVLGHFGKYLFGFGLFMVSIATTITAPLASALLAQSFFKTYNPKRWAMDGIYYRITWILVLSFGLIFAIFNTQPEFVIIVVQALNGLLLPFVAFILLAVANNPKVMGEYVINWKSNILLAISFFTCLIVGLITLVQKIDPKLNLTTDVFNLTTIIVICTLFTLFIMYRIIRKKNKFLQK